MINIKKKNSKFFKIYELLSKYNKELRKKKNNYFN